MGKTRGEAGDRGVREAFDERSSSYYADNYGTRMRDPIATNLQRRRQWMAELSLPSAGRVLELGSGPGALAESLTEGHRPVVSLDLSLSMLQAGQRRLAPAELPVCFCAGRCQALPFAPAAFNQVVAAGVLEYVPELDAALDEIARVLQPGGRAILSFPLHRLWFERWAVANARWIALARRLLGRGRSQPRLRHRFTHTRFRPRALRLRLVRRGWSIERAVYHQFVFLPWDLLFPRASAWMTLRLERWLPRFLHPWLAKSIVVVVRHGASGERGA